MVTSGNSKSPMVVSQPPIFLPRGNERLSSVLPNLPQFEMEGFLLLLSIK